MTRSDVEQVRQQFEDRYRVAHHPAVRALHARALGSPVGGTSYTTWEQVEDLVDRLGLGPGVRVLDIGAGTGWPGLVLAELSGCDVVLVDLPVDGLLLARRQASERGLPPPGVAVADGSFLPFRRGSFDAVTHSDVLC